MPTSWKMVIDDSWPNTRPRNLLTARSNPSPVTEAIRKELSRGHTAGPFSQPPMSPFHCSPLGAVPKKDGTFRIILDLSSPRGSSINEGIPKDEFLCVTRPLMRL